MRKAVSAPLSWRASYRRRIRAPRHRLPEHRPGHSCPLAVLSGFVESLLNDARIDFLSMHRDAFGGIDPQTNLIPFNAQYRHSDFVADHERLANASGEY